MKKWRFLTFTLLLPFWVSAQNANVSVTNASVVNGGLEFDVNLAAATSDIFLGNTDLKFSYTTGNFTGATFSRVSGTSNLTNAAGAAVTYSVSPTIASSLLTININSSAPADLADYDERVAKITTTPVRIGRFRLVTISNSAGTAGLACGTMIIATIARSNPDFTETNVPLNTCNVPANIALPVELIDFKGENKGKTNILYWKTASEKNNVGFEVEQSADGKVFQKIGFEKGHGTSVEPQTYQFTDYSPLNLTYYRLKQLDENGHFTYSPTISIALEGKMELLLEIFPNPTEDNLNVKFASTSTQVFDIELVSALGQVVQRQVQAAQIGENRFSMSLSGQVAGMYTLRLVQGRQVYMRRVCLR